jgi:hypothetical protein
MPKVRPVLILLIFLLYGISVASATLYLTESSISPNAPQIVSDTPVQVSGTITIVPSGSTTFSRDNRIQMSTSLGQALWNAVVIVNGHQAAQFEQPGPYLFLNGYLLSYPSTSSVSIDFQVDGSAPSVNVPQQSPFLTVVELNNQGTVVPGSTLNVMQTVIPVNTPIPSTLMSPSPSTPINTPTKTTPTSIPGFMGICTLAALASAAALVFQRWG